MKHLLSFLIPVLLSTTAFTQSLPVKLDEYFTIAGRIGRFNGSVLVARGDTILFHKAYGWRDLARQVPNDTNSVFQLGSITKTFTGAVILQLQEEGKVSLKDPLSRYLPGYPSGEKITLEHLLTHRSGIPDFKQALYSKDTSVAQSFSRPVSHDYILSFFRDKPLASEPGSQTHYSNSGYYLLGMVIEKVTGRPFEAEVRRRFLTPLQMRSSGFDFRNLRIPGRTTGYTMQRDTVMVPIAPLDSSAAYAAGGMYSTTGDLFRWATAVRRNLLLRPETWEEALTGHPEWGYGWGVSEVNGDKLAYQNGNLPGYGTFFVYIPKQNLTIILLSNIDDASYLSDPDPVLATVAKMAYGGPYQLPKRRSAVSPDLLNAYAGKYQLGKDKVVSVTVKGGNLLLDVPGQPTYRLFAESTTDFFLEEANISFTFHRDETGKVSRMTVHQNGDTEATRL